MSSTLLRSGLSCFFLSASVHLVWYVFLLGQGGSLPEATEEMSRTRERDWSAQQRASGDVVSAGQAKILRRLLGPARLLAVLGLVLTLAGFLV